MAKVVDKRRNGTVLIAAPAGRAADLEVGADRGGSLCPSGASEWPDPVAALAGELPSIELEDIKAARHEVLQSATP